MTRIAFMSDAHIGSYQEFDNNGSRLQRCLDATSAVFHQAHKYGCGAIVDCGDLIDRKNTIDFRTYNKIYDFFKDHCERYKIPFISLVGNHNISGVEGETNLHPLTAFIDEIADTTTRVVGDVSLAFIPYQKRTGLWYMELEKVLNHAGQHNSHKLILVCHQEIKGAVTGTHRYVAAGGVELFTSDLPSPFDYCIFGHYHKLQTFGPRVFYCGALLQQEFGEEGNHQGFWIYDSADVDNEWRWQDLSHLGLFHTSVSAHGLLNLPIDPNDFHRVRTKDPVTITEDQKHNIRVEQLPPEKVEDRLDVGPSTSLDELVDSYIEKEGLSEHREAILRIIAQLQERITK